MQKTLTNFISSNNSIRHLRIIRRWFARLRFSLMIFGKQLFSASVKCFSVICAGFLSVSVQAKFKDILPSSDTHIASAQPTIVQSGGANSSLFLQKGDAADTFGDEHIWLQFDLTDQIPDTATISAAKIRFYVFRDQNDNADLPIEAIGVADNWSEIDLTWNTAQAVTVLDATPAAGNLASVSTLEQQKEFLWYELDVSSFVQDQFINDATKVVSVALQIPGSVGIPAVDIQFRANSKEFNPGGEVLGTFAPRLRVEYMGDWPTSANDITIIHTNDMHSRLSTHDLDFPDADGEAPAYEEAGGAHNVAAKVVELKQLNLNALVLDAGDISEGGPLGDLRGNGGTVDYFQILNTSLVGLGGRGIDGIVVGNHDVREEAMLDNMRDPDGDGLINGWVDANNNGTFEPSEFNDPTLTDPTDVPYLAVNLLNDGATIPSPADWPSELPYRPFNFVTMPDGTNVAVLGYITDDSAILTSETENLIDIKETVWTDSDAGTVDLKDWVDYLRNTKNADVVVLLSHIGHRRLNATTQPLLGFDGDVAPPDVVVSGHWHTWAKTAWQPSNLNYLTTNVEAASYGQYVGELTLTPKGRYISSAKHAMKVADIVIPASGPVRDVYDDVLQLLSDLNTEYNNQTAADAEHHPCILVEEGHLTEAQVQTNFPSFSAGDNCPLELVIGQSLVDLELDKDKWNTLSEFPWSGDNTAGAWITDGMVWKVNDLGLSADLAFQTGGGIRRDLAAGDLTYREIYEAYPWDDDGMVRVQMNSQQVIDFLEDKFVGASVSSGWQITATDGQIDTVMHDADGNGSFETTLSRSDTSTIWDVIISEYMYQNEDFISETGSNNTFDQIDTTPEFINNDGTVSGSLSSDPLEIRNSVMEYTHVNSPVDVAVPRYVLNTEIAGEFNAVVTMVNDMEDQPYFEAVFVRLLSPTAETIARRNLPGDDWGLDGLINEDGGLVDGHRFTETMLYRSHLGFPDGYLQVGDVLTVKGEFGFFNGNPQFVDQEGILSAEEEFDIQYNDPSLAMPDFMQDTASFLVQEKENHLVKFYAERLSNNSVRDASGDEITVYREGGFFNASTVLAGSDGDCVLLIGVHTERSDSSPSRRFRLRESSIVSSDPASCYPPSSQLLIVGTLEIGSTISLTARASDFNGVTVSGQSVIGSFVDYSNVQGTALFAAMDIDGEVPSATQTITFDSINITGETNLQFSAFFAEDDDGTKQDWDASDSFLAEYRIDAGAWQSLFAIRNDGSTFNAAPQVDTDFDGVGDGVEITDTLVNFNQTISDSGSSLEIRFTITLNAGDEDIAFDNVEVTADSGQLFIEDFEDATVNYSTSVAEFTDGSGDFFTRTGVGSGASVPIIGAVTQVEFFAVIDGVVTSLGVDMDDSDGWGVDFIPTVAGNYQFYSVATDNDGNVEWAPIYSDAVVDLSESQNAVNVPILPFAAMSILFALIASIGTRRTIIVKKI